MKCQILHESRGRMRVHIATARMTVKEADILQYYLQSKDFIREVRVYERTGDAIIYYGGAREQLLSLLARFRYEGNEGLVPEHTGRELNRQYEERLIGAVARRALSIAFCPHALRMPLAIVKAVPFVLAGLKSIFHGRIEVALLDATAITASLLRGDHDTATSVMFLLTVGETLEEWTHKKSVDDLARTMSLNVDKVWVESDGEELLLPVTEVSVGSIVIVRTGNMIPLDGKVISGEAMVNQASMTGESMPVRKLADSVVYAGTVVEEGECRIRVEKAAGSGRYDRIVHMIEESERLKSGTEDRASHLADRLVPYSLGGSVLTYLLTRNVTKALAFLMVDFSCALKLSMPLAVLSAMREAGRYHISVKGGKFLEAVSDAETIVFDKTGTLTYAMPRVERVVSFDGQNEEEMLRLAACLEEHYPHSMANAVVAEAKRRELRHEERHTKVEYIVAHGISSFYEDRRVLIGSYHFIFEDEHCVIPEGEEERFRSLPEEFSHLYLAVDGRLSAVILIADPLREEAREVISALRHVGIKKAVMMTGDSQRTASAVALRLGLDEFYAEVLPEDKAGFIRREHEQGRKVIMIGDGVNDSPALSEADAGIAISEGAAIAREVADITISEGDLHSLVVLKKLSNALMGRIQKNYRFIIGFNALLIGLGVAAVLQPANSALLHNISTVGIGMESMTNLLKREPAESRTA
ncbi:MAG: heavy metal translocating P-type ATPase [Oribacterium sp.]